VTEEQFNSVFSNQSAAAGAPSMGSGGAPSGTSASTQDADTLSTTTPVESEPITSEPANDNQPTSVAADGHEDNYAQEEEDCAYSQPENNNGPISQEAAPAPDTADVVNDNAPVEPFPATGTE
jgi:hypothetical protein